MATTEEIVTYRIAIDGGTTVAAQFEKVSVAASGTVPAVKATEAALSKAAVSMDRAATSAAKAAPAVKAVDDAVAKTADSMARADASTGNFAATMGKGLQAFGKFTVAVGALDGALGGVGNAAVRAGANVASFGMAFGPVGIAIGVVTEALSLWKNNLSDAFSEFETKTDEAVKRAAARAQAAKAAAIAAQGTVIEEQGSITLADEMAPSRGGGRARSAVAATKPEMMEFTYEEDPAFTKRMEMIGKVDEMEAMSAKRREENRQAEIEASESAYWQDYDNWREAEDARNQYAEEMAAKHAERENLKKTVAIDALQSTTIAGIGALQKLAKGQKVTTAEVIGSIGEQIVARGTGHILEGTALTVLGNPQGPPLIGVGAAEVAAGLAMGAATRTAQKPAGGGTAAPSSPTSGGAFASDGGSDRPIILNYNAPTVISPTEEDASRLQRVQAEGRRFGV